MANEQHRGGAPVSFASKSAMKRSFDGSGYGAPLPVATEGNYSKKPPLSPRTDIMQPLAPRPK